MSWLSTLGHVVGKGMSKLHIPIVSHIGDAIDMVSGIGETAGGAAKASNANRQIENQQQIALNRLNLEAPGVRTRQALAAALAKNSTPRTIQWGGPGSGLRGELPTYSGGSAEALRKAAEDPMMAALLNQTIAGKGPNIPNYSLKGESTLDKVMGTTATGSSLLAAVLKGRQKRTPAQPVPIQGNAPVQGNAGTGWEDDA